MTVATVGGIRLEPGARFLRHGRTYELVRQYNGRFWIARDVVTGTEALFDPAP